MGQADKDCAMVGLPGQDGQSRIAGTGQERTVYVLYATIATVWR
jgi:hypothetical protein